MVNQLANLKKSLILGAAKTNSYVVEIEIFSFFLHNTEEFCHSHYDTTMLVDEGSKSENLLWESFFIARRDKHKLWACIFYTFRICKSSFKARHMVVIDFWLPSRTDILWRMLKLIDLQIQFGFLLFSALSFKATFVINLFSSTLTFTLFR